MSDHNCICSLLAAGFDSYEIYIPYTENRPYQLCVWAQEKGWGAVIYDMDNNMVTRATGNGASAGEAIWDLTKIPDDGPWSGDNDALPSRIIALAARLWETDTVAAAHVDSAKLREAQSAANESAMRAHLAASAAREALTVAADGGVWTVAADALDRLAG